MATRKKLYPVEGGIDLSYCRLCGTLIRHQARILYLLILWAGAWQGAEIRPWVLG